MNALRATEGVTREKLIHQLYEAAELEHNLMCTYLYAAFSLRQGEGEGLTAAQAEATARWRQTIIKVAVEEMGHLTAVWNITSALGGTPCFQRDNFPLDPGGLPAGVVVKLKPFNAAVLQHFIYLERPSCSSEPEGEGFACFRPFRRGVTESRLTPMGIDYETVGQFYETLGLGVKAFVERVGDKAAFVGDPALQLSMAEVALSAAQPVICGKTALSAFDSIVQQGEGAAEHIEGSHYHRFVEIREELAALRAESPAFEPAFPAATNPVLRPPPRPEGRVWIENEEAAETVDVANTAYGLMLRLLGHAYSVPKPSPEKSLAVDVGLGLMRAVTLLGERAARLPAGPSNPDCNAGMSFTALRDAAPLPPGPSARRFFVERLGEIERVATQLAKGGDDRVVRAARMITDLSHRAARGFESAAATVPASLPVAAATNGGAPPAAPPTEIVNGVERVEGKKLTLLFETKRCIHARFCVTGAPKVFLANVKGPWIHPDAMDVEGLVEVAHACPSGAIQYKRKDDHVDERPPPVNLLSVREAGPYAVRGELRLDGEPAGYRATLCRCGASKNKPFCDGSHHDVAFAASGEPPTGKTDMLAVRDGVLAIDPEVDGPLRVRGNLEIMSGTGRCVARVESARLCRCGGSQTKPFCDGTHAKIGFRST
ncbi:MAG: hypothetical protein HOV80_37420 [Polyangiaceae bacterium]|nr:hypothetical protein [Polyangiaceae bacterium]